MDDKQLIHLFNNGCGALKIGKYFGCSASTAYKHMLRLGLQRPQGRPFTLDNSDKEEMKKLWHHKSPIELSRYFGVQKKTILRWARYLGLPYESKRT